MNARNGFFLLLGTLICIHACECSKGKDIPDVSNIPVEVKIGRFDQDLFALDTNNMEQGLANLEKKYPAFAEVYFTNVLGSKNPQVAPEGHEQYVRGFIQNEQVRKLYDTCQIVFPNMDKLQKDFGQAFRFYKYYFPTQPLSGEVVAYVSEYTLGGFLYDGNSIGIGLDFYLGENYPYQAINPGVSNFSQYLTRTFNKNHLVMKSMKLLVQDLNGNPPGSRMLDFMVHNGKELYILDQLLPYAPDSIKLEYSQKQVDWCNDNEANIWAFLIAENLLYSTDWAKYRKLVEYSPNSPGMPDEAPGRTANWLGWQIVKAYMKKFPETTLEELIGLKDAQALMNQSKYKPRR